MHVIFVYGTLKRGFGNNRVMGAARFHSIARLPNHTLAIGGVPFCFPKEGAVATGELWLVEDEDLARIDRLEGHPNWYRRTEVIVEYPATLGKWESMLAEAYLVSPESVAGMPTADTFGPRPQRLAGASRAGSKKL